jgi:hypothetical protein
VTHGGACRDGRPRRTSAARDHWWTSLATKSGSGVAGFIHQPRQLARDAHLADACSRVRARNWRRRSHVSPPYGLARDPHLEPPQCLVWRIMSRARSVSASQSRTSAGRPRQVPQGERTQYLSARSSSGLNVLASISRETLCCFWDSKLVRWVPLIVVVFF